MTIDERFDRIDAYLRDMRGETVQRLEAIENRLDILASEIRGIHILLAGHSKAALDYGGTTLSPRAWG